MSGSANDVPIRKVSARIILDPPAFVPPPEMWKSYLDARAGELDVLYDHARNNEWKDVFAIANHIRGSGAMYGFPNMGSAAEELSKAIQNGDLNACRQFLEIYAKTVRESYV